jgi:hypothetical protein
VNTRERIARAWHEGSDHAKDGTPFGGPLCNCWQVAGRIMPMLRDTWGIGFREGVNAGREEALWPENPYPYQTTGDRHADQ